MVRIKTPDVLFAAGHFLDHEDNIVDVDVFTGKRPDPATGREVGHFIIDIISGNVVRIETPVGSRDVRHPSVSSGVREAWTIIGDGFMIGFGQTPVESVTQPIIEHLSIDGIALRIVQNTGDIAL